MVTSEAEKPCEDSLSPKKQKVEEQAGDDEDENCPICWSLLSERSSTTLGCKHIFHLDCIGSEFNILGCMQCPTCRQVDPGGNWRFWDNKLPANALLRRVPNPNAPLQSGSSSSLWCPFNSMDFPNLEPQVDHDISRRYDELIHGYRPLLWSEAPEAWSTSTDWYNSDSDCSGLADLLQLDASDSQRRDRVVRDVSSVDAAAIPGLNPSRASSSSANPLDSYLFQLGGNRTTIRRQGSRMHQRRSHDVVSTQEQGGQHAANLNAATGPALNERVRLVVSTAAEGQRRTRDYRRTRAVTNDQELESQAIRQARVPHYSDAEGQASAASASHSTTLFAGMQDPERIGHEIQAMSVAQHDFDEEDPALETGDRHGRQEMSASQSRVRER